MVMSDNSKPVKIKFHWEIIMRLKDTMLDCSLKLNEPLIFILFQSSQSNYAVRVKKLPLS